MSALIMFSQAAEPAPPIGDRWEWMLWRHGSPELAHYTGGNRGCGFIILDAAEWCARLKGFQQQGFVVVAALQQLRHSAPCEQPRRLRFLSKLASWRTYFDYSKIAIGARGLGDVMV